MQNAGAAEAQPRIDHVAGVDHGQKIHDHIADGNDQHQIRYAFIAVAQAEAFEAFSEFVHFAIILQYRLSYRNLQAKSIYKL